MVKIVLSLSVTLFCLTLNNKAQQIERRQYQESFQTVARYAAYKSIVVKEEENMTAYFNQEKVLYYFRQGWENINEVYPTHISVVTFNSISNTAQDKNSDGVEIKIKLKGVYDTYQYMTRYVIKGENINDQI